MRRVTAWLASITLIAAGLSAADGAILSPVSASAHADVGAPSWWNGDCDANHWNVVAHRAGWTGAGAHRLGATYLGVPVCGPGSSRGAPDVTWARNGWGEYEWECTELVLRFMAQIYGATAYSANGNTVVSNYASSDSGGLVKVANGTARKPPQPGDIVSFNGGSFGHAAVIAATSIDDSGNGSVTLLSQNDTVDGWRSLAVHAWSIASFGGLTPYGWLHDPAGRGNPGKPADGTFVSISGHQEVYRIAGGAPVFASSWSPFGGPQPVTMVTQSQFDSLNTYPADSTIIRSGASGPYFEVLAGRATPLASAPARGRVTVIDPLAIERAGGAGVFDHLRDVTAPALEVAPLQAFTTASTGGVSWSATDAGSGIGHYVVRWREATTSHGFGSWQYPYGWQSLTTTTSVSLSGLTPGSDYCFGVQAIDKAGNASNWSPDRCVARVLDDQSLSGSPGWNRRSPDSRFYLLSNTTSTRMGASLTLASAGFDRVGLLATRCATCGEVGLYVGATLLGTINFYAPTTQFQALISLPVFSLRSGTIVLRLLTTGKLVQIDGLAISRS